MLAVIPGVRFRLLRTGAALIPLRPAVNGYQPLPAGAVVRCVGLYWPARESADACRAFFSWGDHTGELSIWREPLCGLDAAWVEVVD